MDLCFDSIDGVFELGVDHKTEVLNRFYDVDTAEGCYLRAGDIFGAVFPACDFEADRVCLGSGSFFWFPLFFASLGEFLLVINWDWVSGCTSVFWLGIIFVVFRVCLPVLNIAWLELVPLRHNL